MIWVILIFIASSLQINAQTSYTSQSPTIFNQIATSAGSGTITIEQNAKLAALFQKNISLKSKKKTIPGYRIRIYSDLGTTARDASLDAKTKFLTYFPDIPVYRSYNQPYFKVYVGDFRTRYEAHYLLKQIQPHFKSAFPVKSEINLPNLP